MFPLGTAAALINENGSRCVSSGLAQLAFWMGSSSTVGACLTRTWTPKSTVGGSVKGDISKEEVWLLRRALAWGLFYCEKPAASAERDATSALCNPGDDTSGGCFPSFPSFPSYPGTDSPPANLMKVARWIDRQDMFLLFKTLFWIWIRTGDCVLNFNVIYHCLIFTMTSTFNLFHIICACGKARVWIMSNGFIYICLWTCFVFLNFALIQEASSRIEANRIFKDCM